MHSSQFRSPALRPSPALLLRSPTFCRDPSTGLLASLSHTELCPYCETEGSAACGKKFVRNCRQESHHHKTYSVWRPHFTSPNLKTTQTPVTGKWPKNSPTAGQPSDSGLHLYLAAAPSAHPSVGAPELGEASALISASAAARSPLWLCVLTSRSLLALQCHSRSGVRPSNQFASSLGQTQANQVQMFPLPPLGFQLQGDIWMRPILLPPPRVFSTFLPRPGAGSALLVGERLLQSS